jgi:hypothetical protein
MGVHESSGQITKALKQLLIAWDETRAMWDDAKSREFEERFLLPLRMEIRNSAGALGEMAALLDQIRRDCT